MSREFLLDDLLKLQKVVNIASSYEEHIDAISGRYVINCKSVMGLLSLNLNKPVTIMMHTEDANVAEDFFTKLADCLGA